jgi:hydroxymethylbilane synthase
VLAVAIKIGARPSPLAQAQARTVAEALSLANDRSMAVTTSVVGIQTQGDYVGSKAGTQAMPLAVGGGSDFTSALDEALLSNGIDAAVHSLKDIPPTARWRQCLSIVCHLPREVPDDVLVGPFASIDGLPQHARVGTSSVRRQAQLLAIRPDLDLVNLRGNVETRLGALSDGRVDALILAQAGLNRLLKSNIQQQKHPSNYDDDAEPSSLLEHSWNTIPSTDMLSAACQGIVAVVCRTDDSETMGCLATINDRDANLAAAAERAFLDTLDGFSPSTYQGSSVAWLGRPPLAAFLEKRDLENQDKNQQDYVFHGLLARPDGTKVLRDTVPVSFANGGRIPTTEAAKIGRESAELLLQQAGENFYQP